MTKDSQHYFFKGQQTRYVYYSQIFDCMIFLIHNSLTILVSDELLELMDLNFEEWSFNETDLQRDFKKISLTAIYSKSYWKNRWFKNPFGFLSIAF